MVVTVLVVVLVAFVLMRLVPGDPARVMLGNYATPESLAKLRHDLGLDRSASTQLRIYVENALHGNLGNSIQSGQPVLGEVTDALPYTISLAAAGTLLAILIGVPLG